MSIGACLSATYAKMTMRQILALLLLQDAIIVTDGVATTTSCTEMSDLEARMPQWAGLVPYSHLVNQSYNYPTDCSGFVSWALQTELLKSYQYASDMYTSRISTDELRYGDVITHVFDKTPLGRCTKVGDALRDAPLDKSSSDDDYMDTDVYDFSVGHVGHVSGHVFFFDRWEDAEGHTNFWAYESTSTQDQTEACLAEQGPLTWPDCFNHHVLKSRDKPDKWSQDNCTDITYGYVTGGPRRLSSSILCD
jgi:hypothetical protein